MFRLSQQTLISNIKRNHPRELDFHVSKTSITEVKVDSIHFVSDSYFIKEIFTYNSSGNLVADLRQVEHDEVWSDFLVDIYTYDDYGKRLTQLRQVRENDTTWMNTTLFTYSYGVNNNRQSVVWQRWVDNVWTNDKYFTFTYDASGSQLTEKQQSWENNLWINERLSNYTYDNNGKCLTYTEQYWHNSEWENIWIHNYTYNGPHNIVTDLNQTWENNQWEDDLVFNYTYDNNGNKLSMLLQRWINGEWLNLVLDTYSYDQNNNRLIEINQRWTNNEWTNLTKKEFVFNGEVVHAIALEWEVSYWDESLENQNLEVLVEGNNLYNIMATSAEFYYSDITGIESLNSGLFNSPLHCYPNPATKKININIDTDWQSSGYILELYTIYGKMVKSILVQPVPNLSVFSFSLEGLPSGIYFLGVDNGKQKFTQKIIHTK